MSNEAVLVTATGSIIGEGIIKCLKLANAKGNSGFSYFIVSADMRADAAGLYRGHRAEIIPSPEDESYHEVIASLCAKHSIRAIFCGSDEELLPLARLAPQIEKETGAKVIATALSALEVAVDKWKTYNFLKSAGIPCAESSLPENRVEFVEKFGYPLIIKPRSGHGSQNLFITRNTEETDSALKSIQQAGGDPIAQQYLPGEDKEFTTGVVISAKRRTVLSSISMRRTLKHGQTYKAFVEDSEPVRRSSEKAALALGGSGPINIQSRLVEEESKVFEINPRFSASCPIRAFSGVNEPDIVFRDQVLNEEVLRPEYEKLVGLRYWNEVYIPLKAFKIASDTGQVDVSQSSVPDYF